MNTKIKRIISHPLFSGSLVMIIGSNITNAINYIYHLIMGRLLGPANYGELVALISLSGFVAILPSALNLPIVKYVSSLHDDKEIADLSIWFQKRAFIFSIALFVLISISSFFIGSFLKIDSPVLIIFSGIGLIFSLPSVFNRSIMQGLLRFKNLVISNLVENSGKLLIGIGLVLAGFSVKGVVWGIAISGFLGWFLVRYFILDYLSKGKDIEINVKPMFLYALPVFIQLVSTTSLYSTDLVLVKHFFSPHDAGIYAALSTLGKIIFFGAGPISSVMFPIVAKRHFNGEDHRKVFIFSLLATCLLSLLILSIYWLVPKAAINLLYGPSYLQAADLLVYFGSFVALFTISSLFINYYLSLGQTKVVIFPLISAVLQIIGIWIYHTSLLSVVIVSTISASLLLMSLFVYFIYETKVSISHSSSI